MPEPPGSHESPPRSATRAISCKSPPGAAEATKTRLSKPARLSCWNAIQRSSGDQRG